MRQPSQKHLFKSIKMSCGGIRRIHSKHIKFYPRVHDFFHPTKLKEHPSKEEPEVQLINSEKRKPLLLNSCLKARRHDSFGQNTLPS